MGFYEAVRFFKPSEFLKWINRYHWQSEELQALAQSPPKAVYTQTIDLSAAQDAGNPLVVRCPGRAFVAYGFTTATLNTTRTNSTDIYLSCRIGQNKPEFAFPVKHNRGFRGDFLELYLSWPAQSGKSCDLVIHQFDDDPWQQDSTAVSGSSLSDPVTETHGGTAQITYTKGDILYASAANTLAKLPIGSSPQILVVQPSGILGYEDQFNLSEYALFFDDFLGGGASALGTPFFTSIQSGTGASCASTAIASNGASVNHPGTTFVYPGTSTTGYAQMYSDARNSAVFVGGGTFYYETVVYLLTLSDGTNTFSCKVGMYNQATPGTAIVTGIYFTYTHSANGGKWLFNCTSASTTTTSDTGVAAAAATWVKLGFVVNAAGTSVQAYVNGAAAGAAIVANIPGAVGVATIFEMLNSAGTGASRLLNVDYVKLFSALTTAR